MSVRPDIQSRNALLASLPAADFALLSPSLKQVPLDLGDVLLEPGERVSYVYFPFGGMISLLNVMKSGEVVETAIIGRDGAFGPASAMNSGSLNVRALVQVPGSGARIGAAPFVKAMRASERLRDQLLHYTSERLVRAQQLAACNALHTVECRFARWLLQSSDLIGTAIVPLTQDMISQMLGVRRTTVTAIARLLQRRGIIRYSRGRIEISDRERLKKHACECYAAMRSGGAAGPRSKRAS